LQCERDVDELRGIAVVTEPVERTIHLDNQAEGTIGESPRVDAIVLRCQARIKTLQGSD
jgi:hypothetical protein